MTFIGKYEKTSPAVLENTVLSIADGCGVFCSYRDIDEDNFEFTILGLTTAKEKAVDIIKVLAQNIEKVLDN